MLKLVVVDFFVSSESKQTARIKHFALTGTDRLYTLLLVMADADTAIYLVEQGRTQIGELAGGDGRVRIQAVVGEELSQVQTLEGDAHGTFIFLHETQVLEKELGRGQS